MKFLMVIATACVIVYCAALVVAHKYGEAGISAIVAFLFMDAARRLFSND